MRVDCKGGDRGGVGELSTLFLGLTVLNMERERESVCVCVCERERE